MDDDTLNEWESLTVSNTAGSIEDAWWVSLPDSEAFGAAYQEIMHNIERPGRVVRFPNRDQRRASDPAPDGERNTENLDLSAIEI